MEIHPSARRHGVADADIRNAVEHYLYTAAIDAEEPPVRVLYLGFDRARNILEVVVIERDDGSELVIHAMKMRAQFRDLLPGNADRL